MKKFWIRLEKRERCGKSEEKRCLDTKRYTFRFGGLFRANGEAEVENKMRGRSRLEYFLQILKKEYVTWKLRK